MNNIDYQSVLSELYNRSKSRRYKALSIRIILIGITPILIITDSFSFTVSVLFLVASIFAWYLDWTGLSDVKMADDVHRAHEFYDSFAVPVSQQLIKAAYSKLGKPPRDFTENSTFASIEPKGSERAFENLKENAYFSKRISLVSFVFFLTLLLVPIIIWVIFLSTVASNTGEYKLTIYAFFGLIGILVIPGAFKVLQDLWSFKSACEAFLNLERPVTELETAKLLFDYQIARQSRPLMPSWIWAMEKNKLNAAWKKESLNYTR